MEHLPPGGDVADHLQQVRVSLAALCTGRLLHCLVERIDGFSQAGCSLLVGRLVLVDGVAQQCAADRLQFGLGLGAPDRVDRLIGHDRDLLANLAELVDTEPRHGEAGEHEGAEAAIETTADTEIEKRHEEILIARRTGAIWTRLLKIPFVPAIIGAGLMILIN
jgi:hypothetical protein